MNGWGLFEYFPSLEEGLLNLDEAARWVLEQREDRRRDDAVDVGVLDGVVGPVVILVDRLEPPNVVVRMRNDVHVDHAFDARRRQDVLGRRLRKR